MTLYSFQYSQTWYRRVTVVADTAEAAYCLYVEGGGYDHFERDGDQRLLGVREHYSENDEASRRIWPSDDPGNNALERLIRAEDLE